MILSKPSAVSQLLKEKFLISVTEQRLKQYKSLMWFSLALYFTLGVFMEWARRVAETSVRHGYPCRLAERKCFILLGG